MLIPGEQVHASSSMLHGAEAYSQAEWESTTKHFLDEGEAFLAYEYAKTALDRYPENLKLKQLEARALLKSGAIEEALGILEPLCSGTQLSQDTLRRTYVTLRKALDRIPSEPEDNPSAETLDLLALLLQEMSQARESQKGPRADAETLSLLASAYKDSWERSHREEEARLCQRTYLQAFLETKECDYYPGINAATMYRLLGEEDVSRDLARRVIAACEKSRTTNEAARPVDSGESLYWNWAAAGEALLLLGQEAEAIHAYQQAADLAGSHYGWIVSSLQQLHLMTEHHFSVPEELFRILRPPAVIVFAGHMIDRPDKTEPRFPPYLENAVRAAIDQKLEELDARIGYCSAAAGADILFIEAMHDRDAEVNIILPFDQKDYIGTSVQHAGPRWVSRFHRAIRLTNPRNPLRYVTEEKHLGDDVLFAFASQVFYAYAHLRAQTLGTVPYLVAVWDKKLTNLIGGTAYSVSRWSDPNTRHIIDLEHILKSTPAPAETPARTIKAVPGPSVEPSHPYKREIKTMLFADIVGFSKIGEEFMPYYMYQFLEQIAKQLQGLAVKPEYVNTWGDAIFAVMDEAIPLTEYALALQKAICSTNWADLGLPSQMSIRIALHAGPVFTGIDPILNRQNFYGSHVNRTARIEPITVPGCVYASEQFTALLSEERTALEQKARSEDRRLEFAISWEPVGKLALAKNFGSQTIYHIRRRTAAGPGKPGG